MVERDAFFFSVEVAYEWLLDFCSHCQNIGHKVISCCWLYPQKDNKVVQEKVNVVKGKKQVPVSKFDWVPKKDNPADIGSSKVFEVPQKTAPRSSVSVFEATDTHMDIVTIPEDTNPPIDSHTRNDVDFVEAQQVTHYFRVVLHSG